MRILILSCNTGQGHNSAGLAVKEAFGRRGVECEMVDALSFGSTSRVTSGCYVGMVSKCPSVFGTIYKAGRAISSPRFKSPVYYANARNASRLGKYIEEGGFNAVVMPHLFPAEMITRLRRRGESTPKSYCVATDYTCIPFWEETEPDIFFIPHEKLTDEFAARGIPREKLVPTGIPVSAKFYGKTDRTEARKKLGLPENGLIFLVMTGSMGFGSVVSLSREILERAKARSRFDTCKTDIRVLIMTGRNEELRNNIESSFNGDERAVAIPFTTEVPLYMDACDVLLSKPGGLTSSEAAVKKTPLVHTDPIPGCETMNAKFFSENGLSLFSENGNAAELAVGLSEDEALRGRIMARQEEFIPRRAADDIAEYIIKDLTL